MRPLTRGIGCRSRWGERTREPALACQSEATAARHESRPAPFGRRTRNFLILVAAVTAAFNAAAGNAPVKIELPPETTAFKLAPGSEIANGQCLTCHSVEYVSTQPPMPRAFWAASVKKMMDKYSAPVPAEQVDRLVEYLAVNYGATTNSAAANPPAQSAPVTSKPVESSAPDAAQLVNKYGCLGCHNATVKIVGPAYRDVAEKYKANPEARRKITEQIRQGGSGKWGPILMPPFPQISDAEIKLLTEWILTQK